MKEAAYRVTDRMVELMDSLDDDQRRKVLEHLGSGHGSQGAGTI